MHKRGLFLFACLLAWAGSTALVPASIVAAEATPNSIVVQTIPGPTVGQVVSQRIAVSWPWYLARAAGFVAAAALFILILSGIGLVTGGMFRILEPLTAWASHRALGIIFGVAAIIHVGSLLFDRFVSFRLVDILVPWVSDYKPVTIAGFHLGSLFVALGVLSFYLVAIIIVTSLAWIDKKPLVWKFVHLLTYLVLIFVFVHALYLGTDLTDGVLKLIWIFVGLIMALAVLLRLRRVKTI
ncbi:MAG: hypothetical protein ABI716_00105 [Candidatus Saccharibacteria bacterium]